MTDDIVVPRNTKRTIIIAVGLLVAVNFAIFGALATKNSTSTPDLPTGIIELFPARDLVVPAQQQVGVHLEEKLTGELALDGVPLPIDEYEPNGIDVGFIFWRPGAGKAFRELKPGPHSIQIHYWPKEQGPGGQDDRTFAWTFKSA
jgi:hypothetical protein